MGISSVHLNNNLLCSVDIETTGLIPGTHETIQIAVVPLGPDLTPSKHFKSFELRVRPENQAVIDPEYKGSPRSLVTDCILHGMERWAAVERFSNWFYGLKLVPGKKIVVLGCNFESFDLPFLVEFFGGHESYQEFFRSDVRDVQRSATFLNDLAEHRSEVVPFPRIALYYLCACLDVNNKDQHDAMQDALATAEVYRKLMNFSQYYKPTPTDMFDGKLAQFAEAYAEHKRLSGPQSMSFKVFKEAWVRSFGALL